MKKKSWVMILAVAFLMTNAMTPAVFAFDEYKETGLDRAWDNITTMGKTNEQRQEVLARNKAERMKRYAEKQAKKAEREAEKAGKEAKKAGKEMKKNLGF